MQTEQQTLIGNLRNWFKTSRDLGVLGEQLSTFPDDLKEHFIRRWPIWARREQLPDNSDWTNWLLLGGRGAGKTRAGAEWVRAMALGDPFFGSKPVARIALVGETYSDAREVMIEGPSGLLALHNDEQRPEWISSRRLLRWSNGSVAHVFSSEDPDALRGPQFGAAWCDAKTIWGSLIAVVAAIAAALGLEIDPQSQATLTEAALQVVTIGGSLLAIFGRLSATKIIE